MCPLREIIDVIGKKWSILVVNAIGNKGKLRFNRIMRQLHMSPRTLSETLKELNHLGLIKRESFNEIPPRVQYTLTKDGVELRRIIIHLLQWALDRTGISSKHCDVCYSEIIRVQTRTLTNSD
jgi:DNA-binding HxlR family transcriptional regulator